MSNPFGKCFLWTPRHDNMRDKSGRFWNYSMFILLFVNIFQYFSVKQYLRTQFSLYLFKIIKKNITVIFRPFDKDLSQNSYIHMQTKTEFH